MELLSAIDFLVGPWKEEKYKQNVVVYVDIGTL
jgi:hypothetical protein